MRKRQLYEEFFKEHEEFFGPADSANPKKAAFMLGVLTGHVLEYQKQKERERSTAENHSHGMNLPFLKKLGNFYFDVKKLKKLRIEVEKKLTEYKDKNSLQHTSSLRELLDELFLGLEGIKVSDEDLSVSFIMGMNLFKRIEFAEKEEAENE